MRCAKFYKMISAFADCEVTPLEHSALQEHFKTCPACKSELISHYYVKDMIKEAKENAFTRDVNIASSVMTRISARGRKPVCRSFVKHSAWLAAAVILIAVLVTVFCAYQAKLLGHEDYEDYANYIYTHVYDADGYGDTHGYKQASLR